MTGKKESIITLLTDFGERDWFVASMKGVVASYAPAVRLIDITHQVPPGDVKHAAWVLRFAYHFFPKGTVHLVVVDPGVGTQRRIVAAQGEGYLFLAPDNGVLTYVLNELKGKKIYRVTRKDLFLGEISCTFHGRDIFAPVAAHLAGGMSPEELGPELKRPVLLPLPSTRRTGKKELSAEIIFSDRFGNLITSISTREWEKIINFNRVKELKLTVAGKSFTLPLVSGYALVEKGNPLAIRGSCGYLELAVNGGSAAKNLGLKVGDKFTLGIAGAEF